MTQKSTKNSTHNTPFPLPHHLYLAYVQTIAYSLAIKITNLTERQQFSAVTVYKIWICKGFLFKNLKT